MNGPSVGAILDLYERWGADRYDEELSQLAHALQTAALAVEDEASDALVAAALLHDLGHLLHLERSRAAVTQVAEDLSHEAAGARFLGPLFPPAVTRPVALHVQAKRLCIAVDAKYKAHLSAGSLRSLELQGGAMTEKEAATFAATPGSHDALLLREWDDRAKIDGLPVPGLAEYQGLLERVAVD